MDQTRRRPDKDLQHHDHEGDHEKQVDESTLICLD
jgi:hypothetical protein